MNVERRINLGLSEAEVEDLKDIEKLFGRFSLTQYNLSETSTNFVLTDITEGKIVGLGTRKAYLGLLKHKKVEGDLTCLPAKYLQKIFRTFGKKIVDFHFQNNYPAGFFLKSGLVIILAPKDRNYTTTLDNGDENGGHSESSD